MLFILSIISCTLKSAPKDNAPAVEYTTALKAHSNLALELWNAALTDALTLQESVDLFIQNPDKSTLSSAQKSWRRARESYSKTEALRFQEGPIDHAEHGVESKLNAWPLDELYIEGNADQKGLIDSIDLELTADLLVERNEALGEESISLGYHAIEFLLWGVDDNEKGPGNRAAADFSEGDLAQRRSKYLTIAVDLLCSDLETVRNAWQANGPHLESWGQSPKAQLTGIFNGLIILSGDEIAGERMAVAYETRDQEDEQSCFSDNTLNDFKSNLVGMEQIWSTSLAPLFAHDSETQQQLIAQFKEASDQLNKIPEPFDQSITAAEGRPEIEQTIEQLQALSAAIGSAAKSIGLDSTSLGGH